MAAGSNLNLSVRIGPFDVLSGTISISLDRDTKDRLNVGIGMLPVIEKSNEWNVMDLEFNFSSPPNRTNRSLIVDSLRSLFSNFLYAKSAVKVDNEIKVNFVQTSNKTGMHKDDVTMVKIECVGARFIVSEEFARSAKRDRQDLYMKDKSFQEAVDQCGIQMRNAVEALLESGSGNIINISRSSVRSSWTKGQYACNYQISCYINNLLSSLAVCISTIKARAHCTSPGFVDCERLQKEQISDID